MGALLSLAHLPYPSLAVGQERGFRIADCRRVLRIRYVSVARQDMTRSNALPIQRIPPAVGAGGAAFIRHAAPARSKRGREGVSTRTRATATARKTRVPNAQNSSTIRTHLLYLWFAAVSPPIRGVSCRRYVPTAFASLSYRSYIRPSVSQQPYRPRISMQTQLILPTEYGIPEIRA